ncbi:MAG TPA: glycosyltransferase family 2 protein [Candidatus Paceibacterota bacterium]
MDTLREPELQDRTGWQFEPTFDYLLRPNIQSFKKAWYPETFFFLGTGLLAVASVVLFFRVAFAWPVLVTLSGLLASLYLGHMLFKLWVIRNALEESFLSFPDKSVRALSASKLPFYTILIPLYQEAPIVPQIKQAMEAIDYPSEKLEILITLEEYDAETRKAIEQANFPDHVRLIQLPNVSPKTKPKALNVAFSQVQGEFIVIYDAEIIPDPDQLKKAVLAFRAYPNIACLQTRLDHYNTEQNLLTRLFNIEFNFYYDLFLPGLQKFGFPLPLSGHSTHFRVEALRKVQAWDPYNVAEDCDMGIALCRMGYRTGVLDSQSKEEAVTSLSAWMRQRTRWMKGFLQSSVVHLRDPIALKKDLGGWKNFVAFLFIVPGNVALNFFNLFYWALLLTWFITHSLFVQELFAGPVLSISTISFIGGNMLFIYFNAIASFKRRKYGLVKYALLSPLYWLLLAFATGRAVVQLVYSPYQWEKTTHGLHLAQEKTQVQECMSIDFVMERI